MSTFLALSAYRPADLILVGLAVLVLIVITGQVIALARHNRTADRAHKPRRSTGEADDTEPWNHTPTVEVVRER